MGELGQSVVKKCPDELFPSMMTIGGGLICFLTCFVDMILDGN